MQAVATAEAAPKSVSFDLKEFLVSRKQIVEEALDKSLTSTTPYNKKIVEAMKYSLLAGGKRIRPIMVLAAYEMIAGTGPEAAYEAAMPTAIAVEMIHTMSLIHDDLPSMDDDDLRRGMPTNHVKYGEDVAILAGDAMLSESFAHVARNTPKSVPAERTLEVVKRLGDAVGPVGLAAGQVLDLECEGKHSATLEELQWIHVHKTAALLEVAVVAGAILAGATEEEIEACTRYARDVGLAFQVADDILDVTATSEELGKTAAKDLESDKTTYVKLLGLDGARKEAERLRESAVSSLTRFGDKAAPLVAITEYIVKRTN
jgi:geranylgeranyl diphosphate synthase type II